MPDAQVSRGMKSTADVAGFEHLPGSWHQTLFCLRQLVGIPFCLAEREKINKYRIFVKVNENNIYIYIYIYIYILL